MSDNDKNQDNESNDLISNQSKKPGRIDPNELSRWREQQNNVPPQQPSGWQSGKLLPKGHKREPRLWLRKVIHEEVPQPKEVQEEIKLELIEGDIQPLPETGFKPRKPRRHRQAVNMGLFSGMREEVLEKWQDFNRSLEVAKTGKRSELGEQGLQNLRDTLNQKLQAAIEGLEELLAITEPKQVPKRREPEGRPELQEIHREIAPVLTEAKRQYQAIKDLFDEIGAGPDDIGQAFEAKRRGIRFSDLKLDTFGDDKLDREKSKEDFAGGQVNKVSKLVYGDETRIFKSENLSTDSKATQIDVCGIDKSAPRFGNRNIATKAMSDILGGTVIPDSCYTVHDGKIGLLMQMAPGEEVKDFKKKGFDPNPPSEELVASLHEQLNQLEWTDMLTGQGDRHHGNYMIDAKPGSVKITGIDNDFCFGKKQGDFNEYGTTPDHPLRHMRRNFMGYFSAELPPLIDKTVFDNLTAKDFDRDVKPSLLGLLSEEEINASRSRFAQMQQHAGKLSPYYVVANWKDWRSPQDAEPPGVSATEFLKASKSVTMFQRDFGKLV